MTVVQSHWATQHLENGLSNLWRLLQVHGQQLCLAERSKVTGRIVGANTWLLGTSTKYFFNLQVRCESPWWVYGCPESLSRIILQSVWDEAKISLCGTRLMRCCLNSRFAITVLSIPSQNVFSCLLRGKPTTNITVRLQFICAKCQEEGIMESCTMTSQEKRWANSKTRGLQIGLIWLVGLCPAARCCSKTWKFDVWKWGDSLDS